jgi:DNA-binding IclR family transcriptional regulator
MRLARFPGRDDAPTTATLWASKISRIDGWLVIVSFRPKSAANVPAAQRERNTFVPYTGTVPENGSRARTSSVRCALQILDLFTLDTPVWGVSEIARRMGVPKGTVARLISDLCVEGYLVRDERRRYRLAMHLYGMGLASVRGQEVYQACLPALIELHRQTRMSAHLAVLDGVEVMHVERLRSDRMFEFIGCRTLRSPVHATCTGKMLLAFASPATRERAIGQGLPRFTDATITAPQSLRAELARVRERGYALDRQEYMPGLGAAAAPIFGRNGELFAALAVVGDAQILSDGHRERTINLVTRIASAVAV